MAIPDLASNDVTSLVALLSVMPPLDPTKALETDPMALTFRAIETAGALERRGEMDGKPKKASL